MAILAPMDGERAAIERDRGLPFGQAAAMRRDQSGAGAGATGAGDAGAALPDPEADTTATLHCRDADIGALREERIVFERRTQRGKVDRGGIRHEERGVRIA